MNVLIPNEELEEKMLPSPTDEKAIRAFASSFDGYEYRDSNHVLLKNVRKRGSLSDLRSELFLMCRSTRHNEGINIVEIYNELYPLFIKALERNNENT